MRLAALLWIGFAASGAQALIPVGTRAVIGGGVSELKVVRGTAYAVGRAGLEILDASDPETGYTRLGELSGAFDHIAVRGDFAYLTSNFGLHVVDVSDPASPVEVGFHAEPVVRDGVFALEVSGRYVLLALGGGSPRVGLRIVDVSNPTAPALRGELLGIDLPISPFFPFRSELSIVREGSHAYVVHSFGGAAVIDVADPDAPALVTTFSFAGASSGRAAIHRGSLFLQGETPFEESVLLIYDIRDPGAPTPLASIEHLFCNELAVVREIAYCATSFPYPFGGIGFRLFDVSDATSPTELGFLLLDGFASGLAVADGFAHLSAIPAGFPTSESLQAVDVRVPEFPQRGLTPQGGFYQGMGLEGERVYAAGLAPDRFDVLDASTPLTPILLGSVSLRPSLGADVEVSGNTAYVVVGAGIAVLDVSDAANPRVASTLPRTVLERAVEFESSGGRLYMATVGGSVEIHDITATPAAPRLLGSIALAGRSAPHDLDLEGARLFVTSGRGISILDVADPAAPREIGRLETSAPPPYQGFGEAAVAGDVLYVNEAPFPLWLSIFDVSDPAQPRQLGTLGDSSDYDIEVVGERLFVGANRVYDVSTPEQPVLIGKVFGDLAFQLEVSETVAYAIRGPLTRPGAFVIDFGPEYLPTLEVDIDVRPGDPHNRVAIGKPGALPVALFGSDRLDVRDVDRQALALGPDGAFARISAPVYVNRDRERDLLSLFWTPDTGIAFGDTQVCLTGRLENGRRLRGCDPIQTLTGCGHGYEMALALPLYVPLARAARRLRAPRRP